MSIEWRRSNFKRLTEQEALTRFNDGQREVGIQRFNEVMGERAMRSHVEMLQMQAIAHAVPRWYEVFKSRPTTEDHERAADAKRRHESDMQTLRRELKTQMSLADYRTWNANASLPFLEYIYDPNTAASPQAAEISAATTIFVYKGEAVKKLDEVAPRTQVNLDAVSDNTLVEVLKHHRERVVAAREQAIEMIEKVKVEFLDACKSAIQEGWLPVDMALVEARVEQASVVMRDYMDRTANGANAGVSLWLVPANVNLSPEKMRHALFHEFTHLISASTYTMFDEEVSIYGHASPKPREVKARRVGLAFITSPRKGVGERKFDHLNEAVTERIAMRLAGIEETDIYAQQRSNLEQLIASGVQESTVYRAYFEPSWSSDTPNDSAPALHALYKELGSVFGEQWRDALKM